MYNLSNHADIYSEAIGTSNIYRGGGTGTAGPVAAGPMFGHSNKMFSFWFTARMDFRKWSKQIIIIILL